LRERRRQRLLDQRLVDANLQLATEEPHDVLRFERAQSREHVSENRSPFGRVARVHQLVGPQRHVGDREAARQPSGEHVGCHGGKVAVLSRPRSERPRRKT